LLFGNITDELKRVREELFRSIHLVKERIKRERMYFAIK